MSAQLTEVIFGVQHFAADAYIGRYSKSTDVLEEGILETAVVAVALDWAEEATKPAELHTSKHNHKASELQLQKDKNIKFHFKSFNSRQQDTYRMGCRWSQKVCCSSLQCSTSLCSTPSCRTRANYPAVLLRKPILLPGL